MTHMSRHCESAKVLFEVVQRQVRNGEDCNNFDAFAWSFGSEDLHMVLSPNRTDCKRHVERFEVMFPC